MSDLHRPEIVVVLRAGVVPMVAQVLVDGVEWPVKNASVSMNAHEPAVVTLSVHPSRLVVLQQDVEKPWSS